MPWSAIIRTIVRIAAGLFVWRAATARRGAYRTAGGPPLQTAPPRAGRIDTRDAVRRLREGASLGWRLLASTALLAGTALLIAGGVTLAVLTPRWLGILLLVLAAGALTAAAVELRALLRLLALRRRRRRDTELRRQIT